MARRAGSIKSGLASPSNWGDQVANYKHTPAQIEKIKLLVSQGRSGISIAQEMNIPVKLVWKRCADLGIRLRRHFNTNNEIRFKVGNACFEILVDFCNSRHETVQHVMRLVTQNICYDGLFNAVLDDKAAQSAKPKGKGWPAGVPRRAPSPAPQPVPKPTPSPGQRLGDGAARLPDVRKLETALPQPASLAAMYSIALQGGIN